MLNKIPFLSRTHTLFLTVICLLMITACSASPDSVEDAVAATVAALVSPRCYETFGILLYVRK